MHIINRLHCLHEIRKIQIVRNMQKIHKIIRFFRQDWFGSELWLELPGTRMRGLHMEEWTTCSTAKS